MSFKLSIPKHTLRFWEKEFKGLIIPLRTKGGQRRYTVEHVSIIRKIRRLRKKGKSLADIHDSLLKKFGDKTHDANSIQIDFLADRVAEAVRNEVYRFFEARGPSG